MILRIKILSKSLHDFSGKKLPSVPPQIIAAGIDLATKLGIYLNVNYYYASPNSFERCKY